MDGNQLKSPLTRHIFGLTLTMCVLTFGCRGDSSPEEVSQSAATFASEVIYNSAGNISSEQSGITHPASCNNCNGLGYYHENSEQPGRRINCPSCQGRGWR